MKIPFFKEKFPLSEHDYYCEGCLNQNSYIAGVVMGVGVFKETFTHAGSKKLDSIVAFDRAEVETAYIGQINMIEVSSFCGPGSFLWGHDLAKKDDIPLPDYYSKELVKEFAAKGIKIKNIENLVEATTALFGTNNARHFPLFPGSHVPCAVKTLTKSGPTHLYGAIAIGIPENREKNACLFMEDVGEFTNRDGVLKWSLQRRLEEITKSILEIGKNQHINYKEIFVGIKSKEIKANEVGCVLMCIPYFLLAKKAFDNNIFNKDLNEWAESKKDFFLCKQVF